MGRGKAILLIFKNPSVTPLWNHRKRAQNKRIICKVGDQKNIWGAKRVATEREPMTKIETALIIAPNIRGLALI